MTHAVLAGIFVGGLSRRMGGRPKGFLRTRSGVTLIDRWRAVFTAIGVEVVLVGHRPEYGHVGVPMLHDEPTGIGPLGGLISLLRESGDRRAIAVAADMPFASPDLVRKLLAFSAEAAAVAPRRGDAWEPLFARYDATVALPIAQRCRDSGRYSLQALLDELGASCLPLAPGEEEQLDDWDCPEDIARRTGEAGERQ